MTTQPGFDPLPVPAESLSLWFPDDRMPRPDMVEAMRIGVEHIQTNMEMLKPGVRIQDLSRNTHVPEEKHSYLIYCAGLRDAWPWVAHPDTMVKGAFDYELEPGTTLCVETRVGKVNRDFPIKFKVQVLITNGGYWNLKKSGIDGSAQLGRKRSQIPPFSPVILRRRTSCAGLISCVFLPS